MLTITPFGLLHANPAGSLQTANGTYTFTPSVCAIYVEDNVHDIEVHGPGVSATGEKIHVEFSSTAQSLEISRGVDTLFASAETQLLSQGDLQVDVDGKKVRVESIRLIDQDQEVIDTDAILNIDCS